MFGSRWLIAVAAISGLICVGIGAMGAHSLPKRLEAAGFLEGEVAEKLKQCEIGVRYQMYHTLTLLALGLSPWFPAKRSWHFATFVFLLGMAMFSGGLYSMVFFDRMGHWSIVPLGGTLLMVGWIAIAIGALFPDKSLQSTGGD